MPRKPDGAHKGFAFVEFNTSDDVSAAMEEKQVYKPTYECISCSVRFLVVRHDSIRVSVLPSVGS